MTFKTIASEPDLSCGASKGPHPLLRPRKEPTYVHIAYMRCWDSFGIQYCYYPKWLFHAFHGPHAVEAVLTLNHGRGWTPRYLHGFFNLLAHVQYFTVRKVSAANKQRYCWVISAGFSLFEHTTGVQGWRSGESTHLPPMWPGFDSEIRRVGWVCWLSTLLREVFSGYSGFPSPQKPTFDLICVNC